MEESGNNAFNPVSSTELSSPPAPSRSGASKIGQNATYSFLPNLLASVAHPSILPVNFTFRFRDLVRVLLLPIPTEPPSSPTAAVILLIHLTASPGSISRGSTPDIGCDWASKRSQISFLA